MTVLRRQPAPTPPAPRAPDARLPGLPVGKVLISLAGASAVGAFKADWNETHIRNPRWPAHAKFHNAQTMVFAVQLTALTLWQLWGRRRGTRSALNWGTLLASLYWLAQVPAAFFPGTALADEEFEGSFPKVAGVELNQLVGQAVVLHPLLLTGYLLESRRLRRAGR